MRTYDPIYIKYLGGCLAVIFLSVLPKEERDTEDNSYYLRSIYCLILIGA